MDSAGRSIEAPPGRRAERDRALFDAIAASYARKDTRPASRHARRERLASTLAAIPGLPPRPAVLEIGCGAGFASRYLDGAFSRYLGIDHSQRLIALARELHERDGVTFVAGDASRLELDDPFDLVVMIGVLHHVEDPLEVLRHARRALRPGGWIAVNEPQPANPLVQLARAVRTRVDPAYSDDQRPMRAALLERLFAEAGLTDVRIRPQGFLGTPFAEVPLPAQPLAAPLARAACAIDRALARSGRLGLLASWNVVAAGRRPPASDATQ